MEMYLDGRDGVGTYVDDRIIAERDERRRIGRQARLPKLQLVIDDCLLRGDATYRAAIEHWIASVRPRIKHPGGIAIDRTVKIPDALRQALGLASQTVLLAKDDNLWSIVGGGATLHLYDPTDETAARGEPAAA